MLVPALGTVGCGLAHPTLPRSFDSGPEVLEEALELGMLAGDVGPLHPPDALVVAAMSQSTLFHTIVRVQVAAPSGCEWIRGLT